MKRYEDTHDFKKRLAAMERLRRGEGQCSIVGAAHADPCVIRNKRGVWDERSKTWIRPSGTVRQGRRPMFKPFDCTAAIEAAESTHMANK